MASIRECPYCFSTDEHKVFVVVGLSLSHVYCDNCGFHGEIEYLGEETKETENNRNI